MTILRTIINFRKQKLNEERKKKKNTVTYQISFKDCLLQQSFEPKITERKLFEFFLNSISQFYKFNDTCCLFKMAAVL